MDVCVRFELDANFHILRPWKSASNKIGRRLLQYLGLSSDMFPPVRGTVVVGVQICFTDVSVSSRSHLLLSVPTSSPEAAT